MAKVWKGRHVVLDTHHAVMVLNATFRESPILYRDLKPGTVLLAKRGQKLFPKVTDFGTAKFNTPDEAASTSEKQTALDARMGAAAFCSTFCSTFCSSFCSTFCSPFCASTGDTRGFTGPLPC